jgi:hypothetical protein
MANSKRVAVKCGRCDGKGAIASFTARYSGKCFACGGSGHLWITQAAYEKQKAQKAEHDAYFAQQRAKHPLCPDCGYAKGGADGYTPAACKCGHGPALVSACTEASPA